MPNFFDQFDQGGKPASQPQPSDAGNFFDKFDSATASQAPKPDSSTWYQRAAHGFGAPMVGLDVLASKIEEKLPFVPKETAAHDVAAAEQEQREFQKHGTPGFSGWELAGNMANPVNYLIPGGGAATALGRAGLAAGGGAASAALQPGPEGDDYWSKKRKQLVEGAAAGTAGHLAFGALGNLISPPMSADAAKLAQRGVQMTPGQMGAGGGMVGRQVRRAEEAFKSFPILGSFIRSGEGRSIESFNLATINQALEPIGERLPKDVKAGHGAIERAADEISDAYNALLPKMNFHVDQQFASDVGNLRGMVLSMPPEQVTQFQNILRYRVADRLAPSGVMDGQTFKQVESELRALAEPYRRSPDAAHQQLGAALNEVRSALRDALQRQNPRDAKRLSDINSSYAMLTRIEGAASRRAGGAATGVFTPLDLLSAVRTGDVSRRKRAFAHGDALMQDWAETAQRILPGKLPDSGTPERAGYIGATLGLLGGEHYLGLPGGPETVAAAALGSLPYTGIGQATMNAAANSPKAQAVRQMMRSFGPYAGRAAAIDAAAQSSSPPP